MSITVIVMSKIQKLKANHNFRKKTHHDAKGDSDVKDTKIESKSQPLGRHLHIDGGDSDVKDTKIESKSQRSFTRANAAAW